eukprot:gnl/Chilomastix_cuspidata/435.p1 GENE.gnl/Chilomastix_cuspidata/435~~gnl/Chilomastix_cuspidata/435.p1  ORF type:complete len:1313 (-),score=466.28 gnl/Chilomastix_cuspidata/435:35-3973(-)
MQSSIVHLAPKDVPLSCAAHVDAQRLYIASRTFLECKVEDPARPRYIEKRLTRPSNVFARHALFVARVALHKMGQVRYVQLVTGDSDGALRGYTCENNKLEWEIPAGSFFGDASGHTRDVVSIVCGPTPKARVTPNLISIGMDGMGFAWNVDLRSKISHFDRSDARTEARVPATCVEYASNLRMSADDKPRGAVFIGYADGAIVCFDFESGNELFFVRRGDPAFSFDQAQREAEGNLPVWPHQIRGFFWSAVYGALFVAVRGDGVYGFDPASTDVTEPVAHFNIECAKIQSLGAVPEFGVGREGVAALLATDGRVLFMRPTYSPARAEGHFIPILAPFSLFEAPPSLLLIVGTVGSKSRALFIGRGSDLIAIPMQLLGNLLVHGANNNIVTGGGAQTHKLDLNPKSALVEEFRFLSLIPEPMPFEVKHSLAERERRIGLRTSNADEELENTLAIFKTLKAGTREEAAADGSSETDSSSEKEDYFEADAIRKKLSGIVENGVCPQEVQDSCISAISESLSLIERVGKLFKLKIPRIDPDAADAMDETQREILDSASAALNTAYPTVGMEAQSGVATAESRQTLTVSHQAPRPHTQAPAPYGAQPQQPPAQYSAQPQVVADDLPPYLRTQQPAPAAAPGPVLGQQPAPADDLPPYLRAQQPAPAPAHPQHQAPADDLPPYLRAQQPAPAPAPAQPAQDNIPPYLRVQQPAHQPAAAQALPPYMHAQGPAASSAYGSDAYSVDAYSAPMSSAPTQPPPRDAPQVPAGPTPEQLAAQAEAQRAAQQRVVAPTVYQSFDAFAILARIAARTLALYRNRANVCDTRLCITFGGREADNLETSLGTPDSEVEIVREKFDRQERNMRSRHEDELEAVNRTFDAYVERFKKGLPAERAHVASTYALRRAAYANKRAWAAKRSADRMANTMFGFFPRYCVISRRWLIVPSPARSFPAFSAFDVLSREFVMAHPTVLKDVDERMLHGIAKTQGIVKPLSFGRANDAFHKLYVITEEPPQHTLHDLLSRMTRALHPHEVAHLLFPLVLTLARIQALPGHGACLVHRDIRPSTIFLGDGFEEFVQTPAPEYDPHAEEYDCGRVRAKRWPTPAVPPASVVYLGAMRDLNMVEPIEFNSLFCSPEIFLGGMAESSDTWSVGMMALKLLLPPKDIAPVTRMTPVAAPRGLLTPVQANRITASGAATSFVNDVAHLSGSHDKMTLADLDDFAAVTGIPHYAVILLRQTIQIQTGVSMQGDPQAGYVPHKTFGQQVQTVSALDSLLPGADRGTLQFLRECLSFNPRDRPSPVKLAHHPWFREHGLLVQGN